MTAAQILKEYRMTSHVWSKGDVFRRLAGPAFCYAAMAVIAATVLMEQTDGLYWLVPVMIVLISGASRNAWDLMLRQRKPGMQD